MLIPARDVRSLPDLIPQLIAHRFERLGVEDRLIRMELSAMETVLVAKTCDRSVLGTMNEFGRTLPFYLESRDHDDSSIPAVEARLTDTPCRAAKRDEDLIWPDRKAVELLWGKWGGV